VDASPPSYLSAEAPLPPFLCRALAFADPAHPEPWTWTEAMTGSAAGVVRKVGSRGPGVHWGTANVSPLVFTVLPLPGYRIAAATERREALLASALDVLAGLADPVIDSVRAYLGLVVWLEPSAPDAPPITSSSFPALPHCGFLTDGAACQLAPDTVLREDRPWALAENLYHESLHQELSATILQEDVFSDAFAAGSAPRIRVPWRRTEWELDRVLHAVYVYSRLLPLRRHHLRRSDLAPADVRGLSEAFQKGAAALAHLSHALKEAGPYLTRTGEELMAEIVGGARAALRDAAVSP